MEEPIVVSERLVNGVKAFEGFRAVPYMDAVGKWTWGYGETQGSHPTAPITKEEADLMLRASLTQCQADVLDAVRVPLKSGQLDACTDFVYNLGLGNFKGSTLLKKLNDGRYQEAYFEFERWVYAGGKILPGLVKRRETEQQWFLEEGK